MKEGMGWEFPLTGGGEEQGYKHPATEFYRGDPYKSLARETVQNSLDARVSPNKPVTIVFEIVKPKDGGLQALRDLKPVLEQCTEELKGQAGEQDFQEANQKIENRDYLCIRDYNTSGLGPDLWEALVKQQGTSRKQNGASGASGASNEASGGSFGIGKNATLAVSKPRTVFYWSRYRKDETSHEFCERFQGKAVLVSHGASEARRQGIGYYGLKDNCQPLEGVAAIPSFFRHGRDPSGDLEPGLALWIAGFEKKNEWRREIASAILANFFLAIHEKKLDVTIELEAEDAADDESNEYCLIEADNLPALFDILGQDDESVKRSKIDWELIKRVREDDSVKLIREEIAGFGTCELRVHLHENGDRRVSFLRAGMLITREQEGLKRFPRVDDFYATFRCLEWRGNKILRSMENPAHNQFEKNRLEDGDPSKKQFDDLTWWIRDKIKEVAGRKLESNVSENVRELAEFFPDPDRDSDDGFPGGGHKDEPESSLGGRQRITPLPPRKPKRETEGTEPTQAYDGDGDLPGETPYRDLTNNGLPNSAKDAANGMSDDGGTTPPDSWDDERKNRKETSGKSGFPVRDIRFVSMEDDTRSHFIYFTPKRTGVIGSLSLSLAGDAGEFKIEVKPASLPREVEKGKRCCIKIRTAEALPGVAKIVEFFYAV